MLKITKHIVYDEYYNPVAVQVPIREFECLEEIIENHGLARLMEEAVDDEKLSVNEAKDVYHSREQEKSISLSRKVEDVEKIISEKLRFIPARRLPELMRFIDFLSQHPDWIHEQHEIVNSSDKLTALRGRGKGEHLVSKLFIARREDRNMQPEKP